MNLERMPGQLRLIVKDLELSGYIEVSQYMGGGDEGGMHVNLRGSGVEAAEDLLDRHPEYGVPLGTVGEAPASDRYVRRDDNVQAIEDAQIALTSLKSGLEESNEVELEDKLIAISEVAAFEATLVQQRIPIALIERFVGFILKWLARKFPDAAFQSAVGLLIVRLATFT
jgi:hypothetical protein